MFILSEFMKNFDDIFERVCCFVVVVVVAVCLLVSFLLFALRFYNAQFRVHIFKSIIYNTAIDNLVPRRSSRLRNQHARSGSHSRRGPGTPPHLFWSYSAACISTPDSNSAGYSLDSCTSTIAWLVPKCAFSISTLSCTLLEWRTIHQTSVYYIIWKK